VLETLGGRVQIPTRPPLGLGRVELVLELLQG
jgi:hypothetical protein